jgi:hypothetical protein
LRHQKNRVLVYLIAELCRRNGNFVLATQYFERFLERERGPRYLKHAARNLMEAARQRDSSEKTMEETLSGEKPRGGRGESSPSKGPS